MDILYYSNFCKHSKKLLSHLVKHDIVKQLNCICVDQRRIDQKTGQTYVLLENAASILLPPNVHSVPALLLVEKNYNVLLGDAIYPYFQSHINDETEMATQGQGEPIGMLLSGKDIRSEQFTFLNATPDDLSAKGTGRNRQMHNYISANEEVSSIRTPPDTYKPNRLKENDTSETIQNLQQQRNREEEQTPFQNIKVAYSPSI